MIRTQIMIHVILDFWAMPNWHCQPIELNPASFYADRDVCLWSKRWDNRSVLSLAIQCFEYTVLNTVRRIHSVSNGKPNWSHRESLASGAQEDCTWRLITLSLSQCVKRWKFLENQLFLSKSPNDSTLVYGPTKKAWVYGPRTKLPVPALQSNWIY